MEKVKAYRHRSPMGPVWLVQPADRVGWHVSIGQDLVGPYACAADAAAAAACGAIYVPSGGTTAGWGLSEALSDWEALPAT